MSFFVLYYGLTLSVVSCQLLKSTIKNKYEKTQTVLIAIQNYIYYITL